LNSSRHISNTIVRFIRHEIRKRKARGVIVGLSGGLDSAVTVTLAVRALGSNRVFGLILPDSSVTPNSDTKHAIDLAKKLKIKYKVIELSKIKKAMLTNLPKNQDKLAVGNLLVRLRMIYLYYYASVFDGLVLGTGDKSEISLGYFTKYGDGAVDLQPIGDVYKTEVKFLAKYLAIPQEILDKKSSARLWKGHTAESEIGVSYEDIDKILRQLFNGVKTAEPGLRHKAAVVKKLMEKNKHKHEVQSICKIES